MNRAITIPIADSDLESALRNLVGGEATFHDGGETVVLVVIGHGSRTQRHLTKNFCQTLGRRWFTDSAMGGTGLINISDLGSHKVWDRVGMERAYTAMRDFDLQFTWDFCDASSGDAATSCQDGFTSNLFILGFTRSETLSSRRQCRAWYSWCRNSERVMLATQNVSRSMLVTFDASFDLRYFAILATNGIIFMNRCVTDFETTSNDVGNIVHHTWRKGGQVGRRGVMVRQISQGVRAARRHGGASD
jgi:hypothetical protein